ncbi:ABC transporter substrate-binding protein [Aliiruegeria lutimaris]|uniref:Carbohydrate ABC transporter substrate-binding protein, CUT1 family (TC 3.A.1.1.-) n=1 Tax=Aliiruegeria lutimaris TaxID=571298 RepID=A0A1G8ZUQ0_9RHOB|nr:extracellular solute-binding protein [Aliiruegeria lutimaris]SDK18859.1 carbohydrate ABC transporter substrate-binding protein, CUT1 family (TC 3.A.1.1.-) [Aliiruegeria lutimaris]
MTFAKTGLSRRAFIQGTTAVIGAAAFGAHRAAASVPAPIGDLPKGVTFRWIDSGDQKAVFYKKFFADYAKDRGIEVVYDALPWNEIAQVVPLGVRNNSAHDVFALPQNVNPADAVAQGWVQPYDDFIPDIATWKASFPAGAFLPGINEFDGKTYGLPFTSNKRYGTHLLYNKAYMTEAGYDPEAKPLNWTEFRDAAKKITEAGKGRYFGFIIGGNQLGRWSQTVRNMGRMAGASAGGDSVIEADIDFRTGDYVFDSDAYIAAIELLIAMQADGSVFPGIMSMNAPQARAYMPQGAAGMILQRPWNIGGWEGQNPEFDFGVSSGPVPDEGPVGKLTIGQGALAPNTMWLFKGSELGPIAGDIFHYLGTVEGQTAWANIVGAGDPPIFPEALEGAEMSYRSKAILQHFNEAIRVGPNPVVGNSELGKVIGAFQAPEVNFARTVQGLVAGELKGVAQEMKGLKDRYNAALDAAFAKAKADGAAVDRSDLVFSNWNPNEDFGAADY